MDIKKFIVTAVLASAALHAAPVGNTSAPDLIEKGLFSTCNDTVDFRLGYEGDFVSDGRMQQQGGGRVDNYSQDTNSATLTCNFQNRMDIYGVFGSSETEVDWRFTDPADQIVRIEANTKSAFLWATGLRVILVEWCNTSLGCGARYSSSHYRLSSLYSDGIAASTEGAHFHWREWQVNLDISYKIHLFTPYIGVKYSSAHADLNHFSVPIASNGSGDNDLKNRNPVGLYLGCSLSTGKYVMLNVEGRLIDEEAVTISGDIRF
ncbi:MAG TPA: hypothetical protein VLF94_01055 [Chlamydiales bacterium]|nr:hypothetical protein [Chlamydiales bacterium]